MSCKKPDPNTNCNTACTSTSGGNVNKCKRKQNNKCTTPLKDTHCGIQCWSSITADACEKKQKEFFPKK